MRLRDIIFKDLRIVLRDRVALMFIFLMPVVLIVILSFALGGMFTSQGFSIGHINIAVVDNDTGQPAQSAGFDAREASIYSLLETEEIASFLSYKTMNADKAGNKLDAGEIDAYITIPNGFSSDVYSAMSGMGGGGIELSVTGSLNSTLKAGIVNSIVKAYAETLSRLSVDIKLLINAVMQSGNFSQQTIARLDIESFVKSLAEPPPVGISLAGVSARKPLTSFSYYSIAITCMFVLYAAGQGSAFLYTESEERTLQRLSASGISSIKLLCGKAFTVFALCLIQLAVLLGFSTLVFGISWGDPFVFLAISACVAVSVTGLGILLMVIVYRTGNPSIGNVFQSILVQVLALLGGSFLPLAILPKFFSTLALFTPNGLAVMAYSGNVSGAPFAEILPLMAGSTALGLVLMATGAALFPRERRV